NASDQPFEYRRSRQQDFMGNQPSHGPIEKHPGPIGARPAERVKPALKPESARAVAEVTKPVPPPDLDHVRFARPDVAVIAKRRQISDPQLLANKGDHAFGGIGELFEKSAEE